MSLKNFFIAKYWLAQPTPAVHSVYWVWVAALLLLVGIGLFAYILRLNTKQNALKKLFGQVGSFGIWLGLSGLLFFAFRQQNVYFLGWRVWFLPWTAGFVFWGGKILYYALKRLPEIRSEQAVRMAKEKYLP